MSVPKYAKLENERRFLVDAARLPDLTDLPFRQIEDRYVTGARLRLRSMTDSVTGVRELKFGKKYEGDDPVSGPITTLYLSEAEHTVLSALPARTIAKRRYWLAYDGRGFGVDVFEGELAGLMLCEAEAETREAIVALAFPPWAARDVTADRFFTGGNLAVITAAELAVRLKA